MGQAVGLEEIRLLADQPLRSIRHMAVAVGVVAAQAILVAAAALVWRALAEVLRLALVVVVRLERTEALVVVLVVREMQTLVLVVRAVAVLQMEAAAPLAVMPIRAAAVAAVAAGNHLPPAIKPGPLVAIPLLMPAVPVRAVRALREIVAEPQVTVIQALMEN